MNFTATEIRGVFVVDMQPIEDDRGFFARSFSRDEFAERGLSTDIVQCSVSWNRKRATLRGMHYQIAPHEEAKLVRCAKGAIYDVALDLRIGSESYRKWIAVELTADNRRAIYIPTGCAHGFQTLVDDSEVHYQISERYHPESARGVRWNDPALAIRWPFSDPIISARDQSFPMLDE